MYGCLFISSKRGIYFAKIRGFKVTDYRPACRAARQRGGCVRQGASSPFRPSGMCGGLRSRLPDIRIPLSSLRDAAAGFKEALVAGCVMCGLTGALLPESGGGAEEGAFITPLDRRRVCSRLAGCSLG